MAIKDLISRTIACEAPGCKNTVTFDPQNQEEVQNLPTWLRTTRTIQLGNRQTFLYCSDVCEVNGVTTGNHNIPDPAAVKGATEADVKLAAVQAEAAKQADQALRAGSIKLTDGE